MNIKELRSIMAKFGETNSDLATLLNISEASVSAKINERNTEFKQGEIAQIIEHYKLSSEQIKLIFFN